MDSLARQMLLIVRHKIGQARLRSHSKGVLTYRVLGACLSSFSAAASTVRPPLKKREEGDRLSLLIGNDESGSIVEPCSVWLINAWAGPLTISWA